MKSVSLSLLMVLLVSCSSTGEQTAPESVLPEFNVNVNCSPRALEELRKPEVKLKEADKKKSMAQASVVMKSLAPKVQACYEESLAITGAKGYNLCTVVKTSSKGKLEFLDVDDYANKLNLDFYRCLIKAVGDADYKGVKSVTISQLFRLVPKKK